MNDPEHEIMVGATGTGKSTFTVYKVIYSLKHNLPVCYIDPKGDTYPRILWWLSQTEDGKRFYDRYGHRIILLNPVAKCDYLTPFNALEPLGSFDHATPDPVALVANCMTDFLRRQSGFEMSDANRMQNIMNALLATLSEGSRGTATLFEAPLLLSPHYTYVGKRRVLSPRNPIVEHLLLNVRHPGTRFFWERQWPLWSARAREEWPQSTNGRIFPYIFDERSLMSICSSQNACLDFQRIVDDGMWLFAYLPKSLLSETVTSLLGNLIVTKLFYACMRKPTRSYSYRLLLDEAYNFNSGPLDQIMVLSRYCQLWVTLILQFLDQMSFVHGGFRDERLKQAALANARYFTVFNTPEDKEYLQELMFRPRGNVVRTEYQDGRLDYFPLEAEKLAYQQRFVSLQKRQMLFYDKYQGGEPRIKLTPFLQIPTITGEMQSRLDLFEGQHLRATGRPAFEIRREIEERQARYLRLLEPKDNPTHPPSTPKPPRFDIGGVL